MIAFSCPHCDLKLKVKDEFAGRYSKCPTCKQPLVVPQPESSTQAHVPAGQIDGTASSLAKAGLDAGVTIGQEKTRGNAGEAARKPVQELLARSKAAGQRYIIEKEIARGGMGAVLLALDCDIRREVAIKYMLDQTDAKKKARFVEEAQITGQLEHPNIVPIHELGVDAKKRLFFSMKMVKGRSLKEVIDKLRDNPKQAEKEYSLARLLNILVNVCNGLAYAHACGVVHRDLKPANVMIGDFGEVYVMDWGLAKVLNQESGVSDPGAEGFAHFMKSKSGTPAESGSASGSSQKVSTSRDDEADLTQEGAIMGTPVYMPPEQALGYISEIDARSDVYSLGAILYEMLTLQGPVEKQGGFQSILLRVAEGEIKRPELRTPGRWIPAELSAVAMKALAKDKKDRYASVQELRHDIERFQEGRSVSAKEDTKREMLVKFAKRNKGFSAGAAMTLLVLLASLVFIGKAWLRAESAYAQSEENYQAFRDEQEARQDHGRRAVPAFVEAAHVSVQRNQLEHARAQIAVALDHAPDHAEARLLLGQLLVTQQQFPEASAELERYLKLRPRDADAAMLARLCGTARPGDAGSANVLADVLLKQDQPALAGILGHARDKQKLLPIYQKQIEKAWSGSGATLTLDKDSRLLLQLGHQVSDLAPIKGMQLNELYALQSRFRDLTPLRETAITRLELPDCAVSDLSPLKGMVLTSLRLFRCPVSDLAPLKGMPLTHLDLGKCPVSDVTPLKGMPLTTLDLHHSRVSDLTPLKGMPLTSLNLQACPVSDLTPLKGMPLTTLQIAGSPGADLSLLEGMKLTLISLPQKATGMSVLRRMKSLTSIHERSAADFWKDFEAGKYSQYKP